MENTSEAIQRAIVAVQKLRRIGSPASFVGKCGSSGRQSFSILF
jgi:hypothetical protein